MARPHHLRGRFWNVDVPRCHRHTRYILASCETCTAYQRAKLTASRIPAPRVSPEQDPAPRR